MCGRVRPCPRVGLEGLFDDLVAHEGDAAPASAALQGLGGVDVVSGNVEPVLHFFVFRHNRCRLMNTRAKVRFIIIAVASGVKYAKSGR